MLYKIASIACSLVGSKICIWFRRHEAAINLPKMNIIKPGPAFIALFSSLDPLDTCFVKNVLKCLRKGFRAIAPFVKHLLKGL